MAPPLVDDDICQRCGVRLRGELQRDEEDERPSRYKTRIRAQPIKYEGLGKRYREDTELFATASSSGSHSRTISSVALSESLSSGSEEDEQYDSDSDGDELEDDSDHSRSSLEYEESLSSSDSDEPDAHDFGNEGVSGCSPPESEEEDLESESDSDELVDDADNSRLPLEFEESLSSSDSDEPDVHGRQTLWKSDDVSEMASLMTDAHEGDSIALQWVRTLIRLAERTPKTQRSPSQTYLLVYWRKRPAGRLPVRALEIFVDASPYGIGFIFNDRWLAWKFTAAHPRLPLGPDGNLIMSWAELVAVELGIWTLIAAGFRNVVVTVRSDNQGVVGALESGKWTQKYDLDDIVNRILYLSCRAGLSLKMKWIPTKENPADDPSRGVYPPTAFSFHCRPPIPRTLSELIQDVE